MTPGLPPRAAAWRILHDLERGIPFDRALSRALSGLSESDRALAHEIAAGVLRQRDSLDAALNPQLKHGTAGVRSDLLAILRLGAYQLRFLERVPPHAAVDTAVTLGRRIGGASVGGFINAVLRKVAEDTAVGRSGGQAVGADSDGTARPPDRPTALAVQYSHPEWLVTRWLDRFGDAATERLLRHNNTRPPLMIQPARWDQAALEAALSAQGIVWQPAPFGAGLIVADRKPQELPGLSAGACYVQDAAQALVLRFAGLPAGGIVFDPCAAPGGKAVGLSQRARFVAAADRRPNRARRLRENLDRAGSGAAAVLVADAAHPPVRPCDSVLLDVPCLGTGTFARHPDARWRVSAEALAALAAQAARMLRAQADVVRPGGLLLFATCSLEAEENELQVEAFLAADRRFRREPAALPAELLSQAGDLLLLPQRHGTDGAYAARLRRTA